LTLETIYLGIQQSLSAHNNNDQTQPQENDEHDEKIIEKENKDCSNIASPQEILFKFTLIKIENRYRQNNYKQLISIFPN
ncbi:unnamed protein product, partial [Rotaria socialis]